mmetsp:Transcript_12925/g.24278  ORF Transcript_12925/g.24278 Transcript_12925/m.24278 type:complete len:102 (+) Transcript_12925:448-753(+)
MLVAMTYSVELILSVLTGISLGFYICFRVKKRYGSSLSNLQESSELGMGVLGHCNPCYEYAVGDNAPVDDSNHLYSALGINQEDEDEHFSSLHQRAKNSTS